MTREGEILLYRVVIRLAQWHNENIVEWNDAKNIPVLKAQFAAWLDVKSLINREAEK